MPKIEANINYIPPNPPSSMKLQQNCYCKFSYRTTFDYYETAAVGLWLERQPREREVVGSCPVRDRPKSLKVIMAFPPIAQD